MMHFNVMMDGKDPRILESRKLQRDIRSRKRKSPVWVLMSLLSLKSWTKQVIDDASGCKVIIHPSVHRFTHFVPSYRHRAPHKMNAKRIALILCSRGYICWACFTFPKQNDYILNGTKKDTSDKLVQRSKTVYCEAQPVKTADHTQKISLTPRSGSLTRCAVLTSCTASIEMHTKPEEITQP